MNFYDLKDDETNVGRLQYLTRSSEADISSIAVVNQLHGKPYLCIKCYLPNYQSYNLIFGLYQDSHHIEDEDYNIVLRIVEDFLNDSVERISNGKITYKSI